MTKQTSENLLIYSDGYDKGFANPHVKMKQAKNLVPCDCPNPTVWLDGFKDGKKATGLY